MVDAWQHCGHALQAGCHAGQDYFKVIDCAQMQAGGGYAPEHGVGAFS